MLLTDLPTEILHCLTLHIDNIETFINAASTCRRLHDVLHTTSSNTILRLAAASAPTFFSPHPHYLVAMAASQAGRWALGDEHRTALLRKALQGGIDGLYAFCLEKSGVSLHDIRRMFLSRFSIINPLSDKIDKMAGRQWYETPDFWDGGVSEPVTLYTDANRTAFQIIIYGELFGPSVYAFLEPERNLPFFDIQTRLDYIKHCVPQLHHSQTDHSQTGPFLDGEREEDDQSTLSHVLGCGRWRRMWGAAIKDLLCGGEGFPDVEVEDEYWRETLLRDAIQCQGLEGMQLVTMSASQLDGKFLDKLKWIKQRVDKLTGPPPSEILSVYSSEWSVSHVPDPMVETALCFSAWNREARHIHN